jgi:hypothetical protein
MSTLLLRAAHMPVFPAFARAVSFMMTVVEVFSEAQSQARAAHKRYPFADW